MILFLSIATLVYCALLGFVFVLLLRKYPARLQDSLSLNCYVNIALTFRIRFHSIVIWLLRQHLTHLKNSFYSIVTLESRVLLGFIFIQLLLQLRALLGFIFIQLLRWYIAHHKNSFSFDCYVQSWYITQFKESFSFDGCVNILRTFLIHFYSIVALVFCTPKAFFFIRLLHWYLAHFLAFLSFDGYVRIQHIFRILFNFIVALVSRAFLRIFFIRWLSQYFAQFQDSFLFYCYVSVSRTFSIHFHSIVTLAYILHTFSILCHSIVTLVSCALFGLFFIRSLR